MNYIDGYLLPVAAKNVPAYLRQAKKAARIWRQHGALEYRECRADDLAAPWCFPFPKLMKPKRGEAIFFSWIVFKSRAHRDAVISKVMKDPRLKEMMDPKNQPFDSTRMSYGGFKIVVAE